MEAVRLSLVAAINGERFGNFDELFALKCSLWVLTSQSLDPMNPDPRTVHRRSMDFVTVAVVHGKSSLPGSGLPWAISHGGVSAASERLVNAVVLDLAAQRAATPPPMTLELLASARMAARRFDRRRALVDAGTAVEAALSRRLGLAKDHKLTLGRLVEKAEKEGLNIPSDSKESLVNLSNDAVHRGQLKAGTDMDRAFEVAEELVALGEPSLIPAASLTPVLRPQRLDLTVWRPPSWTADSDDGPDKDNHL